MNEHTKKQFFHFSSANGRGHLEFILWDYLNAKWLDTEY